MICDALLHRSSLIVALNSVFDLCPSPPMAGIATLEFIMQIDMTPMAMAMVNALQTDWHAPVESICNL